MIILDELLWRKLDRSLNIDTDAAVLSGSRLLTSMLLFNPTEKHPNLTHFTLNIYFQIDFNTYMFEPSSGVSLRNSYIM